MFVERFQLACRLDSKILFYSSSILILILILRPLGTSEVHTVSLGATAASAGYYYPYVDGEIGNALSFDANAAAIKAGLEGLNKLNDFDYTVTVGDTVDNATSITITFDQNQDGRVSRQLQEVRLIPSGGSLTGNDGNVSSSVTTYGKKGWATGSSYQTNFYMFKFRELVIDENGNVSVEDK